MSLRPAIERSKPSDGAPVAPFARAIAFAKPVVRPPGPTFAAGQSRCEIHTLPAGGINLGEGQRTRETQGCRALSDPLIVRHPWL
jgi:hypothetical protein